MRIRMSVCACVLRRSQYCVPRVVPLPINLRHCYIGEKIIFPRAGHPLLVRKSRGNHPTRGKGENQSPIEPVQYINLMQDIEGDRGGGGGLFCIHTRIPPHVSHVPSFLHRAACHSK